MITITPIKPIPLEMLIVDSSENTRAPTFLNIGQRDQSRRRTNSINRGSANQQVIPDMEKTDGRTSNPFTILHIGRHGGTYQLFASSSNLRRMWKEKILEAQTKLQISKSNSQVFELFTLNDVTFGTGQIVANQAGNPAAGTAGTTTSKGKVTCSVAFGITLSL